MVIGGTAMQIHGSAYVTFDLDLAFERTRENAEKIASVLIPLHARPRHFAEDVPFVLDAQTVFASEVLTLSTDWGDVDLLGRLKGVGTYPQVEASSELVELDGVSVRVLSIDALLAAKRAAGRPKDQPGIIELEAIKEALERSRD